MSTPPVQIEFTNKGLKQIMNDLRATSKLMQSLSLGSGSRAGFAKGASAIVAAARALDKAGDKLLVAAKALQAVSGAVGNTKAGGSGRRGTSKAVPRPPKPPPVPKVPPLPKINVYGPNGRLKQLQGQRAVEQSRGNTEGVTDIDAQIARLQKQLKGKTTGDRFKELLGSSRIGFGSGGLQVLPLVNKIAGLIGPEFTAIAAVTTAAAGAIIGLGRSAADSANQFSKLQFSLGSNGATTAGLQAAGAAGGFDPATFAGNVHNRITTDPLARAVAGHYGIYNRGGFYGGQDYGADAQKTIEVLRGIKDFTERIRVARVLGAESALPLTQLSDKQYGKIKGDSRVRSTIFDKQYQQDAADFAASLGRVGESIKNLVASLGKPILKELTDWFNNLSDFINRVALWLNNHKDVVKGIWQNVKDFAKTVIPGFGLAGNGGGNKGYTANGFPGLGGGGAPAGGGGASSPAGSGGEAFGGVFGDAISRALDAHAQETRANTNALRNLTVRLGIGERVDNAYPSGYKGKFLQEALLQGGIGLQLSQY